MISGAVILGGVALLYFVVRSFINSLITAIKDNTTAQQANVVKFGSIDTAIVRLEGKLDANGKDIARVEGSIKTMSSDVKDSTKAMYQTQAELAAVWKVLKKHSLAEDRLSDQ
jgi:septal ring factor EnvC (AmiA/AmiB activator)